MSIFTPAVRPREGDPRLELTVAGPHYTVSGERNEGFYYSLLPPSLLERWDVSGPGQLAAWYDGEKANFSAGWVDESILVELDVQYSVRTIAVGPGEPLGDPTDGTDESTREPEDATDEASPDGSGESIGLPVPGFGVGAR